MKLPEQMLRKLRGHAEETYPEECCGLVLAKTGSLDEFSRVRRCRNAQDQFHELDPDSFPRTNRDGYFIDPKDLLAVENENKKWQETIRVVYHSHPDAAAYFSEEDQRRAAVKGEPVIPDALYLVVSVIDGRAGNACLFEWDHHRRLFVRSE